MRLWIGKEEEGNRKGVLTLFVESRKIVKGQVDIILRTAKEYGVEAIYFGAGKVELLEVDFGNKELSSYETILETTNILNIDSKLFSKVIVRFDVAQVKENVCFKMDDGKDVMVYAIHEDTDIRKVKDGKYKEDKIVYYE